MHLILSSAFAGVVLFALAGFSSRAANALQAQELLLTSVRTGDTEIFVVNPITGDARNLSRSPDSEDRYPCWSPDAGQVAFTSDRNHSTNLYVMNADGSHLRALTETTAVCYMPSWSGDWIVFGMHGAKPEMAAIHPDGTGLTMLGEGHDPCISPDGKVIAYTGHVDGGVTVFTMNTDGSGKRQIVPHANKYGATFPNWSPDSRHIVFSQDVREALELFAVDPDGTNLHQVTRLEKISTPAAWSPDGNWISFRHTDEAYWRNKERTLKVYAEKPADKRPVWVIRPDGTDAHVIEALRFQCAIDGSRASWKPVIK